MEDTEIDPYTYGQLSFDRDVKVIQWRGQWFWQMVLENLDIIIKNNKITLIHISHYI